MTRYDSYTPSGVSWLGDLPSSWQCKKVGSLFTQRNVKVSDKEYAPLSVSKAGIVPQLGTAVKTDAGDNRKLVCRGDFVINSRSDRKGSCGVSPLDGSVSLINIVLKPLQQWNERYVHYLLRSHLFSEEFYHYGRGIVSDLWTTRYNEMKNIMLPIPPRDEQDQIVRYLDWQVSKINRLIAAKEKKIKLLQEQEQAIIYQAITGRVGPKVAKKESGIEWAGEIPEEWDVLFLSQVAKEQCIKNEGVKECNLLSLSYGHIVEKDINTTDGLLPISFEGYQIVYPGNIILRLTDLQNDHKSLRTGLVTETGIITSAYTCLKVRSNILPAFLRLQLHAADLCKVFYGMGGGVRQSIGYKDIRRMPVFVPKISQQEEILAYIEDRSKAILPCGNAIKTEIAVLEELKQKLISDVVTGQIDVRGIEVPEFEYVEEVETPNISEEMYDKTEEQEDT